MLKVEKTVAKVEQLVSSKTGSLVVYLGPNYLTKQIFTLHNGVCIKYLGRVAEGFRSFSKSTS